MSKKEEKRDKLEKAVKVLSHKERMKDALKKMAYGGNTKEKWIPADLKKGALHRALDVPLDKKIPEAKLEKATHSKNTLLRERANFAKNAKGFNKKMHKPHF